MGKDISIYGLIYDKIKSEFYNDFFQSKNFKLLSHYLPNQYDQKSLLNNLKNHPKKLTLNEIWAIIWCYNNLWHNHDLEDYNKSKLRMKEMGIEDLMIIDNREHCLILRQYINELKIKIIIEDDEILKFSNNELLKLLRLLIELSENVIKKEEEHDTYNKIHYNYSIEQEFLSCNYDKFQALLSKIYLYDDFVMFDSY